MRTNTTAAITPRRGRPVNCIPSNKIRAASHSQTSQLVLLDKEKPIYHKHLHVAVAKVRTESDTEKTKWDIDTAGMQIKFLLAYFKSIACFG